jgi:hypothetical protein
MARKGKDELDQLQKYRAQAKAARKYMRDTVWGGKASGGALKAIDEAFGAGAGTELLDEKMGAGTGKKSKLLLDVSESGSNLGRLMGSSKGAGIVQKSTSPNIPRTDQGIRNLPKTKIMGESAEENILRQPPRNVGKDTPPTRTRNVRGIAGGRPVRPSDEAYFAMRRSEKTLGKLNEIKGIGKEISTARTSLSKALVRMIEAEGLDVGTAQKAKAYELAGGAVSNRDRARLGLPRMPKNPTGGKGRVSQPVQPSVAKKNTVVSGSKFEPTTQKGNAGVPSSFIKGLGAGGIGGAFNLTNPGDAAAASNLNRMSGGGGGVRSGKLGGKKLKI